MERERDARGERGEHPRRAVAQASSEKRRENVVAATSASVAAKQRDAALGQRLQVPAVRVRAHAGDAVRGEFEFEVSRRRRRATDARSHMRHAARHSSLRLPTPPAYAASSSETRSTSGCARRSPTADDERARRPTRERRPQRAQRLAARDRDQQLRRWRARRDRRARTSARRRTRPVASATSASAERRAIVHAPSVAIAT